MLNVVINAILIDQLYRIAPEIIHWSDPLPPTVNSNVNRLQLFIGIETSEKGSVLYDKNGDEYTISSSALTVITPSISSYPYRIAIDNLSCVYCLLSLSLFGIVGLLNNYASSV